MNKSNNDSKIVIVNSNKGVSRYKGETMENSDQRTQKRMKYTLREVMVRPNRNLISSFNADFHIRLSSVKNYATEIKKSFDSKLEKVETLMKDLKLKHFIKDDFILNLHKEHNILYFQEKVMTELRDSLVVTDKYCLTRAVECLINTDEELIEHENLLRTTQIPTHIEGLIPNIRNWERVIDELGLEKRLKDTLHKLSILKDMYLERTDPESYVQKMKNKVQTFEELLDEEETQS